MYAEPRQRGEFPPRSITELLNVRTKDNETVDADGSNEIIKERASTIVITGDASGFLWICSIWSSLVEGDDTIVQESQRLLNLFSHQQSTGRDLVFLFLLGLSCEKLSVIYERNLDILERYMESGVSREFVDYKISTGDALTS